MTERMRLTRRGLLAGGLSAVAGLALAEAPLRVPRPPLRAGSSAGEARPLGETRPVAREEIAELVREAGLEGKVSIALVDVDDGTVEASYDAGLELPPASVAKALTALYALEFLGPDHRFATRLLATGPVKDGRLEGDLILAGGGDPIMTTDRLAELARALEGAGIREVEGEFQVWGGALPPVREISPEQLPWVGYNPSVGGLNLNFNRVHFEWAREGGDYEVSLEALGDNHGPPVTIARMRVEDRSLPVYTYEQDGDRDQWTVARRQLGNAGSRWLPVRTPDLYAGEAFAGLAEEQGAELPAPTRIEALPAGATEIARVESDPLEDILRDMLLHSTNITAEVVGMAATVARGLEPETLADSAAAMNEWLRETTGARVRLVDHSGLGGESRVAALEMALALASRGTMDRLRPLLKTIVLTDRGGNALRRPPGEVRAKTGTLNFATALAGYVETLAGGDLAFAYFSADVEARAEAADDGDEIPPGSREFLARSRRLQQVLLQRWGRLGA